MDTVQSHYVGHRRNYTRWVLLVAAIVIGLVVWWFLRGGDKDKDKPKGPAGVAVDTAPVTLADVPQYAEGLGTVQAFFTATVAPRVDGTLLKVAFTEGQSVKKGDLLAQIDPRPYQAVLDQARANRDKDRAMLENAKRDLDRYEVLAPSNLASKQQVDTQKALVSSTEAQIKSDDATISSAQTQLDYTTLLAPIDGRTGIRLVDPGNNVHSTDTTGIVVVTQLQPISVIFTLPEDSLPAVSAAMNQGKLSVVALARDGKAELDQGTVLLIDNQIDPTTGTVRLKATFPNARNSLWPGEFVNAKVLLQTLHQVTTIPATALQRGPKGVFTYIVKEDSTVEARPLKVSSESESVVVVDSGLKAGEKVVTSNQYRLQPNTKVTTAKPDAKDGDAAGPVSPAPSAAKSTS